MYPCLSRNSVRTFYFFYRHEQWHIRFWGLPLGWTRPRGVYYVGTDNKVGLLVLFCHGFGVERPLSLPERHERHRQLSRRRASIITNACGDVDIKFSERNTAIWLERL